MKTLEMRDYQIEHIYNPIINKVKENIRYPELNTRLNVLGLSTSAGKTFTLCNFVMKSCLSEGCDIIYTSPNATSLDEVEAEVKIAYPKTRIIKIRDFSGGAHFPLPNTDEQVIYIVHPTSVSQNKYEIGRWSENRKLVVLSDEAHKGFMCPDKDSTEEAHGYHIDQFTAEWYSCGKVIPNVGWFLVSATPLTPTENPDLYEIISYFFDRDILSSYQAANKAVHMYGDRFTTPLPGFEGGLINYTGAPLSISALIKIVNSFKEDCAWVNETAKKWNLPKTKQAMIVQAESSEQAQHFFNVLPADLGISIDSMKYTKEKEEDKSIFVDKDGYTYAGHKSSYDVMRQVIRKNTQPTVLIANKSIGESVNIPGITSLVTFHRHSSVKNIELTHVLEQVLGRCIRWPDVEGIKNWYELIEFKLKKLEEGMPEEILNKWIDLVFNYEVHLPDTPYNVKGVEKFFSKHTRSSEEWPLYTQKVLETVRSEKQTVRKKYGETPAQKSAQKGPQSYKNYKDVHRDCESCSPLDELIVRYLNVNYVNEIVPGCKIGVLRGDYTEKEYHDSMEVHHKDGDRFNNTWENYQTNCRPAHLNHETGLRDEQKSLQIQ